MKKITVLTLGVLMVSALHAEVRYVTVSGNGNGTSWENASGNIQAMVDSCYAHGGGEVRVGAGTYIIQQEIAIKSGVDVLGAYPATGGDERDLENNLTILDANNKPYTRILNASDKAESLLTAMSTWDGFVLQNATSGYGSAAFLSSGVVLKNCIIRNNNGASYGAIMIKKNQGASDNIGAALINCLIVNNTTSSKAGAIFIETDAHCTISNCLIANNKCAENSATAPGGVFMGANLHWARFQNNIFYNNHGVGGVNNFYSTSSAKKQFYNNWFDDDVIPTELDATGSTGNKCRVDFQNPLFVNPATVIGYQAEMTEVVAANWQLEANSPCIDNGEPKDLPHPYKNFGPIPDYSSIVTDLIGADRINGDKPDMGPYEYYANGGGTALEVTDAAKGHVYFAGDDLTLRGFDGLTTVRVLDLSGKMRYQGVVETTVNLNLPQGMYIVTVNNKSYKVIK